MLLNKLSTTALAGHGPPGPGPAPDGDGAGLAVAGAVLRACADEKADELE